MKAMDAPVGFQWLRVNLQHFTITMQDFSITITNKQMNIVYHNRELLLGFPEVEDGPAYSQLKPGIRWLRELQANLMDQVVS